MTPLTATSAVRPTRSPARAPRHVLIVEDDFPIRAMLTDALQDAGYAVAEAANGFAALEYLRAQRPDLVVLDLMLPEMSGWEFLERSRAQLDAAGIPVVILSAIRGQGDYPASLGVAAWFSKPVELDQFVASVKRLARRPEIPSRAHGVGAAPFRRPHMLVVEDDVTVRELIREHLDGEGHDVHTAASVAEARMCVAHDQPDLVVLDLMLPGISGWSFLEERRNDPRLASIPVLVVSAAHQQRLLEAKDLGANAFLSKPFDLEVLSALVGSLIR